MVSGVQTSTAVGLEAVATAGACSLADLVRPTDLTRPTAHRLAVAFEQQAPWRGRRRTLRAGRRLVGWGAQAAGWTARRPPGRSWRDLVEETGESAQLYVREGVTASASRPRALERAARHGPARCGDAVDEGIGRQGAPGVGRRSGPVRDIERLRSTRFVAEVGRRAWATRTGRRECRRAGARHDGQVVAAISVSGPPSASC